MNIGLGVYDIFSRIVPGGFYLFTFIQFARVMNWIKIDWTILKDIGILPSVGILLVAYTIGAAMDRIGSAWHRIFKKRRMSTNVLNEFKNKHSDRWVFDFEDKDLPVLSAYIRIRNPDIAQEIDRHNAVCIMLRNLSLGLFLLAIIEVIQAFSIGNWTILVLVSLLVFLSFQIAIQARVFRDWSYSGIFETIIAYRLDLDGRVKPVKYSAKRKNE